MKPIVMRLVAAACLAGAASARADNGELAKLQDEFQRAQQKFFEEYQAGGEYDAKKHPAVEFMPRFRAFAEANAGKPEAIQALLWIMQSSGMTGQDKALSMNTARWALKQLEENHLADAGLAGAVPQMRHLAWQIGGERLAAFYEKVIKKNPSDEAKASAMFNLADIKHDADEAKAAEKLLRTIVSDYPTTKAAEQAGRFIFEIEHLQIGMKAPDFVGEDVHGNEIKLSQFHGNVVVIDFWGFW